MIKVDLHVHSRYSADASGTIPEILRYARSRQLDAIAVTDHDTFEGSLAAIKTRSEKDVQVIPGIELTIPAGEYGTHIIGLYIENRFPYPNIIDAVRGIKQQGGIVVLPHPFRPGTGLLYNAGKGLITDEEVAYVLENVDYIEGLNLKDSSENVARTLEFVRESGRPMVSGTDAHIPAEIGVVYCELESLDALKKGAAAPSIVAYTRGEPPLSIDSLGQSLAGHGDEGGLKDRARKKIRRTGVKIIDAFPGAAMRAALKRRLRKMLAGSSRSRMEEIVKSPYRVKITRDERSRQVVLTKV
ncbi:MAG: hypothetical protein A2137_02985 [Chloroflexi bacterium RBG_16_58_8]|nr:MAG: hypothetical protein A2137_02985 [Chloroflexi bacterium RBG_16_58_8]